MTPGKVWHRVNSETQRFWSMKVFFGFNCQFNILGGSHCSDIKPPMLDRENKKLYKQLKKQLEEWLN
jgi:hypothetical protein